LGGRHGQKESFARKVNRAVLDRSTKYRKLNSLCSLAAGLHRNDRFLVLAASIVIAAMVALSIGVFVVPALETTRTVTVTTTTTASNSISWEVVKPNVTVHGYAAGIPCGALMLPCVSYPNQSIRATLIKYNGNYYYVSYFGVTQGSFDPAQRVTTWYTIWYTNSTEYCVSPKVQWDIACP